MRKLLDSEAVWIRRYGNCGKGSKSQASCCSNAELLSSGFDWTKFSKGRCSCDDHDAESGIGVVLAGNSCKGDTDLDRTLGE
eukprot:2054018-Rhodomonas_salina.1